MGEIKCGLQVEGVRIFGGIQVVIQGDKGFVSVWRRLTLIYLEEKKLRFLSHKKQRKLLTRHELCEGLLKEDIWGDILLG